MEVAESLLRSLPAGFSLLGMRTHELGGVRNDVATYAWRGRAFSLVLGGEREIGWDPGGWEPTDDERESYAGTAEEYDLPTSLVEHVANATLRRRTVAIKAMLVETSADEVGWERADDGDPDVREAIQQLERHGTHQVTIVHNDSELRIRGGASGVIAERSIAGCTHESIVGSFAHHGFRLATSDEWEYLCGGGSRTLFRWGDHAPCDRYPTWRRERGVSREMLERPAERFDADWELHRRPNALGLTIASDPYKWELVAEPDRTRGGDGGVTICGGAGYVLGWLSLASAYFEDHASKRDPAEPILAGYTVARRVLPI